MNTGVLQNAVYNPEEEEFLRENQIGRLHPDQKKWFALLHNARFSMLRSRDGLSIPTITMPKGCSLVLAILGILFVFIFTWPFSVGLGLPLWGQIAVPIGLVLLGGAIWYLIQRKQQGIRRMLSDDLARGDVHRASAELVFDKRWHLRTPQGDLKIPWFIQLSQLTPGIPYTVYFLPQSRYLIACEPITLMGAEHTVEPYNQTLSEVFSLDKNSLPDNRQGRLSAAQKSRLWTKNAVYLILILVTGGGMLYYGWVVFNQTVPAIILTFVAGGMFWSAWQKIRALNSGRVNRVEGIGSKYERTTTDSDGTHSTTYYLKVNGRSFEVGPKAYRALIAGRFYRAYYLDDETLVNLEALEEPEPSFSNSGG